MIVLAPIKRIQFILKTYKTIAVVGMSPKKHRPSRQVAEYMQAAGYRIIPVNPGHDQINGQPCHPSLQAVPVPVDLVNIFRRSDQVLPIVRDAIAIGAKAIWMQEGIINEQAARMAEKAGLMVIMDRCLKTDHLQFYTQQ